MRDWSCSRVSVAAAFTDDSAAWCSRLLDEADVAVTPGNDFGHHLADRHVRFSYATGIDRIELALDRLARFVKT